MRRLLGAALVFLTGFAACRTPDPPQRCPARFAEDATRGPALVEALRATTEGAGILARLPPSPAPHICFGPATTSAITPEGVILFTADLQGPEATARLGHLLLHLAEGLPMARPTAGDCATQVDVALAAEARALAVELRLRRELGAPAPSGNGRRLPYAFEDAFWAAPPAGREALILAYLRAHPDGAPGLDALAAGYARRCAEAR